MKQQIINLLLDFGVIGAYEEGALIAVLAVRGGFLSKIEACRIVGKERLERIAREAA